MTRPGIEPRSPGPLANTLTAGPMSRLKRQNKNKQKQTSKKQTKTTEKTNKQKN